LHCGRTNANKVGSLAKARVQIGRSVLWNVDKINKYLDEIATE